MWYNEEEKEDEEEEEEEKLPEAALLCLQLGCMPAQIPAVMKLFVRE